MAFTRQTLAIRQYLLYALVSTLVLAMFWVGVSVYFSTQETTTPPDLRQKTLPLSPTLDVETINALRERHIFSESELSSFPILIEETELQQAQPTPTPVPTTAPTPSPSPSPEATPEATPAP